MHVLFGPTLVVYDDVVLFAGGEKMDPLRGGQDTMTALSADSGVTRADAYPRAGRALQLLERYPAHAFEPAAIGLQLFPGADHFSVDRDLLPLTAF